MKSRKKSRRARDSEAGDSSKTRKGEEKRAEGLDIPKGSPLGDSYSRYLVENTFDLVVVLDSHANILYISPSVERLLGYPRDAVLGVNAFDFIHLDDERRVVDFYQNRLGEKGYSGFLTFRVQHRDGTWRHFEAVGNNLLEDPQVRGVVVNAREITDRVKLEEGLRRAEEKYRTIFDEVNDGIMILDIDTARVVDANSTACKMFGYSLKEMRKLEAEDVSEGTPPYTGENLLEMGRRAARGEPQVFDWLAKRKSGDSFWLEVNFRRTSLEGRDCLLSVVRDISERKKAAEDLRESEEYFRSLIEHAYDVLTVLDADGTIRYTSSSVKRHTGRDPEEITGRSGFLNIHSEDVPRLREIFFEGLKTPGKKVTFEYRLRHVDGSWHHYEATGQNLMDNPHVRGIVVHSNDITERRRLEENLRKSEEYHRSLIENTSDVITVLEADGTVRYVSPSVTRNSGYAPEEIAGKSFLEFAHPDDIQESMEALSTAMRRTGVTEYAEIRIRHKDGTWHNYEASSINLLDNPNIAGIVVSARDITERKEAESFARAQRDMAVAMSGARALGEVLRISLHIIITAAGMDCGGIYLLDDRTGGLDLLHSEGLPDSFIAATQRYEADSPNAKLVAEGEPFYSRYEEATARNLSSLNEGLQVIASIPFKHEGRVTGCLNLASHERDNIPERQRERMEILAGQLGQAVARSRLISALRESEEKYRLIYDFTGEAIYTYDTQFEMIGVNPKACELIGYTEGELVGRNMLELGILHPDDYERTLRDVQRLYQGEVVNDELRFIKKDGTVAIGDVTGAPLYDRAGNIIAFTNVARDVTEQKRVEQGFARLNQCLLGLGPDPLDNIRSITLAAGDIMSGFFILYCRMDKGRLRVFSPDKQGGDFVEPPEPDSYICYQAISSNRENPLIVEDLEGSLFTSDPEAAARSFGSFMGFPTRFGEKATGCLCAYRAEKGGFAREDMNFMGMLARAITIEEERMAHDESIRHFVDIASHELRTPLSIIKGYADAFQEGDLMELNQFQMNKIRIINDKADKMTKTINDLMDVSRIERGQFSIEKHDVELESLIASAIGQMKEKGSQNDFSMSVENGVGRRRVDPEKFVDALLILLDNSSKYSPADSEIAVRARTEDGGVVVSVMDRGEGVQEKDRDMIFERFYQTEELRHHSATGMGLGLFIAKGIVEGHGGRIWYEPREGGGSIFSFNLP